jgi:hypothetical protein
MSEGTYMWLLPVWLIGAPFVIGLVELARVTREIRPR